MHAGVVLAACVLAGVPAGGRDPFAPPPSPAQAEARTALQRLEIAQLRLVALLHGGMSRALLEDEAGIGYVASLGTPVGPRGGAVVGIEPGTLRIREPGNPDEIVLELRAAPGEQP